MTKLLSAVLALYIATIAAAEAGCPAGTRYDCQPTFNGKMSCGCR